MAECGDRGELSDFQTQIMNVVWDHGAATVSDVVRELSASRPIARSTAQTMLVRLEERGWLTHRRDGSAFRYSATVPRSAVRKKMVARMVDRSFAGSPEGLVLALIDGRGISGAEAERIRKLIDQIAEDGS